jgi:hypothetical protein
VESSSGRRYVTIKSAEGGLHQVLADHPQLVECHHALIDFRLEMTCMDANAPIFDAIIDDIIVKAKPEQLDAEAIFAYRACRQRLGLMAAQQHLAVAVGGEVYSADTEESADIAGVAAETESDDAPAIGAVVAPADADSPAAPDALAAPDVRFVDDLDYVIEFVRKDAAATELEQLDVNAKAWVATQSRHLGYLLQQQATEHGQEEADRLAGVLHYYRDELEMIDTHLGALKEPQYLSPMDAGKSEDEYKQLTSNRGCYTFCTTCRRYYVHKCFARTHQAGRCPGPPVEYVLSAATLVLALLVGAECKPKDNSYDGRALSSSTDSLQHFLAKGQPCAPGKSFLYKRLIPRTQLVLVAHSNCARSVALRREYLKQNHLIIFQKSYAVPVSTEERAVVRASPTLNRLQPIAAPVPEA